jgi:SAM-dependent methyltransferase
MRWSNRLVGRSEINQLDLRARIDIETRVTDAQGEQVDLEEIAGWELTLETLRHIRIRGFMLDHLGPLEGKQLLDLGCGYSMSPVCLASGGAIVSACDVSPRAIDAVRYVAEKKGLAHRITLRVCAAEQLPFEDASFDLIYGGSVLHHIDLDLAGPELARVLKPGGRAVFTDPLGHNRLLEFARDYLPYGGKHKEKGTDLPLTVGDIERFGRNFSECAWYGLELFAMAGKPFRMRQTNGVARLDAVLGAVDDVLLKHVPRLQKYCRYAGTCVVR